MHVVPQGESKGEVLGLCLPEPKVGFCYPKVQVLQQKRQGFASHVNRKHILLRNVQAPPPIPHWDLPNKFRFCLTRLDLVQKTKPCPENKPGKSVSLCWNGSQLEIVGYPSRKPLGEQVCLQALKGK